MKSSRFNRQSFLGPNSQRSIEQCRIGIVGLGGGGSHISQQMAYLGSSDFALFDKDHVEEHNLNRLIGGTAADVAGKGTAKVKIAARLINRLNPLAKVEAIESRWQDVADRLRNCDVVFGCVDSFAERRDLEVCTRRFLIPYIDIGLDVHQAGNEPNRMAGQVILSMPGDLCMWCMGFLTEPKIAHEAEAYGKAGGRPQVVWANGVLASTAVGVAVDLITDWTKSLRSPRYLCYDANTGSVFPHPRMEYLKKEKCQHFPIEELGVPRFHPV